MNKPFWRSNTIQLFTLVALGGGLDLLDAFINQPIVTWRDCVGLGIGLAGIALRIKTTSPISLN